MPGRRVWCALISSTAYFITIARPSPYWFILCYKGQNKGDKKARWSGLAYTSLHYFPPKKSILLPSAADVVRLVPLAEVAGELVNGKEPSEHNVSRQTEETGWNVLEPFRSTAAQFKCPEQHQQREWSKHNVDKLEMEARRMWNVCTSESVRQKTKIIYANSPETPRPIGLIGGGASPPPWTRTNHVKRSFSYWLEYTCGV